MASSPSGRLLSFQKPDVAIEPLAMMNIVRRPEFGAFAAFVVTYIFFAIVTQGAGFVSVNGTAG
jgi:hypothetical protein